MISYDTKLKLKDLLVTYADDELSIEKLRQVLASIKEFEPYAAFKRIDRDDTGFITAKKIAQYLKENGYREISKDDAIYMVRYFDQDSDNKLTYHDFLQILLPCDDAFLRAAATQRPNYKLARNEYLPMRVEKALTNLLVKELKLQMKAENLKRNLEQSYDFSVQSLFKAVDDWNYTYIDDKNLRRFLRNVGHLSSKQELVAIIRRVDTDGDAKVNIEEFGEGIRSQFSLVSPYVAKVKTQNPSASFALSKSQSKSDIRANQTSAKKTRSSLNTPNKISSQKAQSSAKKRPASANKAQTAQKHRQNVLSQIYGVRSSSPAKQYDDNNSPSRLNKSVTFNNQVRVREYGDAKNPLIVSQNQYSTPSKNLYSNFEQAKNDFTPSPVRNMEEQQMRQNVRQLNMSSASPNRYSTDDLKHPRIGHGDMYNVIGGSPLRQPSPKREQNYNNYIVSSASQDRLRMSHLSDSPVFDAVEKGEVAKILKDSIFLERELESAKLELSLKPDFNLLDLFRILDPQAKGYVTALDLQENLNYNLQIDNISRDDCYLFFRRYDLKNSGRITFGEFCQAVTPLSKEYAQIMSARPEFFSRKIDYPVSEYFNVDTRVEVRNLFRTMFQTERASECLRTRIAKRPHFTLESAFQYLDRNRDGVATAQDVRDMLAEHGFYATEKEMNFVMFKFDKDRDTKISFSEFVEEMSPKLSKL